MVCDESAPKNLTRDVFVATVWECGGFKDFLFSPLFGKIPILTNIFQRG